MADFGFLRQIPRKIGGYLERGVGMAGEYPQRIAEVLRPPATDLLGEYRTTTGEWAGERPMREGESEILESLRKGLAGGKETKAKEPKQEMGSMTITTPTPEGGKVTIKVDVPTWPEGDKPPFPQQLWPGVQQAATARRIDPNVLASLIAQEVGGYGYEPRMGAMGERGITQINPALHWMETGAGATDMSSYAGRLETDPEYAIQEAARILQDLLLQLGFSLPQQGGTFPDYVDALAAYNAGLGNIPGGQGYAGEVLGRIGRGSF